MKYYVSLGHVRGTLIARYFLSEDEEIRKGALDDCRNALGSLVLFQILIYQTAPDIC
jgi:hypothetical protein